MTASNDFCDLMTRLHEGDQKAAAEVVERYGPVIRRVIRVRLLNSRLRRYFDSMDVFQSVMFKFFSRATGAGFELDHPQQLVNLFIKMTQNAFVDRVRREQAGVRKRTTLGDEALQTEVDPHRDAQPAEVVARKELAERARELMSDSAQSLATPWSEGRTWIEIAAERGATPDALRVKFRRSLDRVKKQLAPDDTDLGLDRA